VIGQQHAMTGQVSAAWNVFLSIPTFAALLIGGTLSGMLEEKSPDQAVRILFLAGTAIMGAIALYALWRPRAVFDNIRAENGSGGHRMRDIKRLVRHWPIYPAMLIWVLWNFAPGSVTPLQYHLQNTLHATDGQWGQWNAIFAASFIPTFIVYGLLCRKYPLKTLLLWGTIFAVPQMVPLLFIHTVTQALIAAVPIGLMGGLATGAGRIGIHRAQEIAGLIADALEHSAREFLARGAERYAGDGAARAAIPVRRAEPGKSRHEINRLLEIGLRRQLASLR